MSRMICHKSTKNLEMNTIPESHLEYEINVTPGNDEDYWDDRMALEKLIQRGVSKVLRRTYRDLGSPYRILDDIW
jgi:hypothetical protein